jgi:O-methyltransferase involved in polyketide biosynthesis
VNADGQPSQTALTAAAARAAHLIVDNEPVIFADTLAEAMLGERAEEFIAYHRAYGTHPVLAAARAQVTCRSRYAEDSLARHGFGPARDIGQRDMIPAAAWERSDSLCPAELSRIAHAVIPSAGPG